MLTRAIYTQTGVLIKNICCDHKSPINQDRILNLRGNYTMIKSNL